MYRRVIFISAKSDKLFSVKKTQCSFRGYTTHEYELSNHLVCLDNSYYSNAYAALCCMGICCNSPLLGRKGVRENEIF